MGDLAIVMAKTKGGLIAVVKGTGFKIIAGTERQFTSLTTFSDGPLTPAGHIDTAQSGWVAYAEHQ